MLLKIRKITGTWQRWRWMKMKQLQSKVFKQKRHKKHHKFSSYFDPFLSLSQLGHHSPGGASTSVLAAWYGVIRSALCALCGHVDPAWFIHHILQSTPIHTNPHQTLRFLDLSIYTDIHWPHQIQSNSYCMHFIRWPLTSKLRMTIFFWFGHWCHESISSFQANTPLTRVSRSGTTTPMGQAGMDNHNLLRSMQIEHAYFIDFYCLVSMKLSFRFHSNSPVFNFFLKILKHDTN